MTFIIVYNLFFVNFYHISKSMHKLISPHGDYDHMGDNYDILDKYNLSNIDN